MFADVYAALGIILHRFGWYYKRNDGQYQVQGSAIAGVTFGLHVSLILEDAYQKNELGTSVLRIGYHAYTFDAENMTQKNRKVLKPPFFRGPVC